MSRVRFSQATSQVDAEAELVFGDLFDNALGVSDEVGIGGTGVFGTLKPSSNNGTEAISQVKRVDSNACFIVTTTQIGGARLPLQVKITNTGTIAARSFTIEVSRQN